MKTHIPATLRKALIAALFATATYSAHAVVDITNKSTGFAETTLGSDKTSTGYTDLTFSGTNSVLGTVNHWCHDYNNIGIPDYYNDRQGDDTEITLTPDERTGKYIAHSITSNQGKDTDTNLNAEKLHNHGSTGEFGYSYSWSNGNINVTNAAVMEVTTSIRANGTTKIEGSSRVTAGNEVTAGDIKVSGSSLTTGNITVSQNELWVAGGNPTKSSGVLSVSGSNANVTATGAVSAVGAVNVSNGADLNAGKVAAGEISVNGASLTAGDITVTKNELWVAGGDPVESSGELRLSGANTNVTATGVVSAVGGVDVSNSAHLNASTITSKVTGSKGYVRALPGENLKVTKVASEGTQYIVDNGCTITLGDIGVYDEENKVMHGNGNYFGYGPDSNNIKADAIYVMGNIISDDNELVALGGNVDNRLEDSSYSAILVQGSITGNGNKLFVREQDSAGIWVTKGVSGDNNVLETKTSGDIHIAGTLGRSKDSDDGAAKGNTIAAGDDVTIHQLDDNENLIIDALNGEVVVEVASEATLINSTITADGSITFASDASKSTKVLTLVGGSVESDTGDIVSNQVIRANGTALTAEEGDINVYSLTYDPENTENTGIQVTAQNLISEQDLTLDGTENESFDSFVTVTEDMRTTKGSISITNFTDKDTVNVGHDIDSAASITVKNVNGMLVGTEDEDGIEYEGSMTAQKDIEITDSIVEILGDQEATDGKISITKADSDTRVTIDGDQTAGTTIATQGATLRVGILVEEEGADGKPVYSVEGGKQVAGDSINIAAASIVEVLDSQEAKDGTISITGSTVTVGAKNTDGEIVQKGNQTAGAHISIEDSTVTVLGSETAGMDITVTDSAVNVGGSQTSTEGSIVIQSTEKQDATPSEVTVGGDQLAAERIKVADGSTLKVGTLDTDAKTGVVTLSGGNQQADGEEGININAATANVLGNQTATLGAIDIKHGSRVTVGSLNEKGEVLGGNQTAETDIMVTDDSQLSVLGDQTANQNITIVDSMVTVLGDQKATEGYIDISSTLGTGITSEVSVGGNQEAGTYISVANSLLTVGTAETVTDEATGEEHVVLTGGNQTADTGDIVVSTSTVEVLADQTATEGGIKIDKLSLVAVGTLDADGKVLAGDQLAKQDIAVDSSTLTVLGDQTSQEGNIIVQALEDYSVVMVGGTQKAKKNISILGSKEFDAPTTVLVGEDQTAEEGNIAINDASVVVNGKVVALGDGSAGAGIVALAGATYVVGTSLEAKELNIGTIDNPSDVTINLESLAPDGETPLSTVLDVDNLTVADGNTLHTGNVKMDAADVAIHGVVEVGVKDDEDPANDIAADWKVTGSHDISGENAHLMANGDIEIVAAEEGDTIRISDGATVSATGDVTIQGLAAVLAEVDGATVRAAGDITLDNAELTNNTETDITTKGSNIVLKNRVEISDTTLNVLPPEEGDEGVINVAEDADVQLYQGTVDVFNGKLAGTGSVTANDVNLVISHDSRGFNGTINMVHDNEQTLYIVSEGVGEDATINLEEGSSLGTMEGGQDANLGNVVTTDGSHIQMNAVDKGNRTTATSLTLTAGTTYELFATTDENGAMISDNITVTNGINANGARVRAHSDTPLEALADGSRFTIAGGTVVSAFNEDVLYDMVQPDAGEKRTARALQTRNMHLEHNANGVDLVVSENYKAIDHSNANVNAVREIILPLDAAADHRPGKLAQSASNLDHILDALDYTRSGADAKAGLLSVSAATNLIVPNMMMDASRHHLSTLRDHMATPVCTKDYQGKGNVWAAYTGGHDYIGSDDNMGKYTHSYNGAIIGGDYAVNCNWAVGLSFAYQNSIARAEATRADADAISGDLYAVGRTGKFVHRFSMGMTSYNTDVKRGTRIAAKGHTYDALSTGDADGMSWNFGYQLSRSYAINQVSSITPYLAVDVALQRIDTMTEKGQGDASVVTDYEDFVQTDAALGVSYSHTFTSFNQQAGVFAFDLAVHGEFSEHRATAKNHFVDSPENTWKTRSAKRAPLYGELGGHVLVPFTRHFSGTAGLNFEFSDDRTYIGGHAGVNYRF